MYINTGELLESAGHDVSYFSAKSDKDLDCKDSEYFCDAIDTKNAGISDVKRFLFNEDARNMLDSMMGKRKRVDIAHLHIYYGRLTSSILKPLKTRKIPVVQSLHEYKLICPVYTLERNGNICEACVTGTSANCVRYRCRDNSLHKSALLWLEHNLSRLHGSNRLIDRFICVSDFQREMFVRAGISEHKLITLHNFVDAKSVQPKIDKPRQDYLLYFGRIEKLKGVPTLLEAVAGTDIKLKIAGVGAWSAELRERVRRMPNVEYLEFVSGEPLKQLVAQARAVVVPSEWYETFGLTALEAKAVGTPVIASRIGGLTEVIREGEDGFLFEPGDVESLRTALKTLEKADIAAMTNAARQDVASRFSPETYLARLLDIYATTINETHT
ncbi:glycosyltransferase family 4 protein [Martelella mediterranea]|uniref:glycosyltransferase family 4 protein n=1 Tax=Martelella mediterranea TaxID=293089 RepID=UPI00138AF4D4